MTSDPPIWSSSDRRVAKSEIVCFGADLGKGAGASITGGADLAAFALDDLVLERDLGAFRGDQ